MTLTLLDKIMIDSLLPKEGNIKTLIIIKDIRNKIKLTQDQIKDYSINVLPDGRLTWNEQGSQVEFDIEFTELENSEIKLAITKLDRDKKLSVDHLSLVALFNVSGE